MLRTDLGRSEGVAARLWRQLREGLRALFEDGLNDGLILIQARIGRNLRGQRIAPENLERVRAAVRTRR